MSWMEKLYQTYESGIRLDLPLEKRLMPISHTPQNAHINIIIDGDGNFKDAKVLEKTQIILPATEDSATRSSNDAPHGLADKLQYVAKDYESHGGKKKPYFESYEKQLRKWCESEQGHEQVKVVLRYIQKGTVIADLSKIGVLIVENGQLITPKKFDDVKNKPAIFKVIPKDTTLDVFEQGSALVCWTVEKPGYCPSETWKDSTIQTKWITFDTANGEGEGLCYITGQQQPLSTKHPAKIRHSGDKAKLISSNDTSGYTYRGKFLEDNQACGISFEVSQKAHNALGWLIQRQGFRNGDQAYVAWAVSGEDIPAPLVDAYSVMVEEPKEIDLSTNLAQDYAIRLRNYMAGYAAKLKPNEQIIIMGIDSATPGRMGIIYYREMFSYEFIECLEKWHEEFAWYQRHTQEIIDDKSKKKFSKTTYPISSPIPKHIAFAAYGENVTDNLKKKTIERLLPCIVDGSPFPFDLVESCVRKVSNRNAYPRDKQGKQSLWEDHLGITCALYRGYAHRGLGCTKEPSAFPCTLRKEGNYYHQYPDTNQRRSFDMALEENYHSRDYLYGRLLAVAERIEEVALNASDENRPTNAARLMQRFADRPAQTWLTIYKALDPYMQRLQASAKPSLRAFLHNQHEELETISSAFVIEAFNDNAPLSGEFLLGYYCQRQKMKQDSVEKAANYKAKQTKNLDETTVAGEAK
ncbi:type I-C CRISPR-associated protein Cas8c/Csd1 [Methylovulum sp.]|uniref:type I-C CRISPR-associated protein Cas8c/Csd1 n=1 Tax=Methylovulum sp. TaxID=1916980 RepID=UPI002629ED84|nr:type I-C CRISPR-associated protein Cas8c/Csd1 [Methylovulum sp.]MDD5125910.1 type I-C CRISPR-associated protein Cas8c/Csd1 [Methylovulum sp.]